MADLNPSNFLRRVETWRDDLIAKDLPFEAKHEPPEETIVKFETVDASKIQMENKERKLSDYFNDEGQKLCRESANDTVKCKNNADMIKKMNDYEYADVPSQTSGCIKVFLTLGGYYWWKRRIIPDGNFGHYISSGRHMLIEAGIHALLARETGWAHTNLIPCDMEINDNVEEIYHVGSKTILTVQENCIGGAFRIGKPKADDKDGEYVLFTQGRYVLRITDYRTVQVVSLTNKNQNMVKIGPITICYIKEGFLGGALEIATGEYKVFPPGPPYLLHRKYYTEVEIIERRRNVFTLGPLTYVKVRDGELAGAYSKKTGKYQILPPGHTYRLNSRDYKYDRLVERAEKFKLGPFVFLTVKKHVLAGVYQKKGGRFILLPPGNTYQLSDEDYEDPIDMVNNKHKVVIGPLTYLTLEAGKMCGAYRVQDGEFEEFTDTSKELMLHCTEYHSLRIVDKYRFEPQRFGPYKIITIPEGFYGVFQKEGVLEIQNPGFYKLSHEYEIKQNIPKNVNTEPLEKIKFKSKEGIKMRCSAWLTWQVNDPKKVALFPGNFSELVQQIMSRFEVFVRKISLQYNRNRLLPTKQDVLILSRNLAKENNKENVSDQDLDEMLKNDVAKSMVLHESIETKVHELLNQATENCRWGVTIHDVRIHDFKLSDDAIESMLKEVTEIVLTKDLVKVQGKLNMAKAEASRLVQLKKTDMDCVVGLTEAKVEAEINKLNAEALAEEREVLVDASSKAKIDAATVESKGLILREVAKAEADAKTREIELEIKNAAILQKAQAQSNAIKVVAEANYQKKLRSNEAAGLMTEMQFQLKLIQKSISAMDRMGKSAWRMPDKYMKFYDEFAPMVQLPTSGK